MSPEAVASEELHIAMTRLLPETATNSLANEHAPSAFTSDSIETNWSDAPGLIH
jgi:hypothetical protein